MDKQLEFRVRLNNICVRYKKDLILTDVLASLQKGHIYGLLSRNGVGKTTLLKVIAGVLAVSSGTVEYNEDVRVGYSIDDSLLVDGLTVEQNYIYYSKICGTYKKVDIEDIIELTGVSDYKKKYVKRLSKGMKQRTSIGISLVVQPNLLLWDEAISGVDVLSRRDICEKLFAMVKERQICMVAADHNLQNLLHICDDLIFLMRDGRIDIIPKCELFNGANSNQDKTYMEQKIIHILENDKL